jgi:adenosylhomocysteine nucleosidase
MLLITAAMQEELKVALSQCRNPQKRRLRGVDFWLGERGGRGMYFLKTGVGPKRSAATLQAALEVLDVSQILVVGYAGALDPQLKLGTLVVVKKALFCNIDKADPAVGNMRKEAEFELAKWDFPTQTTESTHLPLFFADTLTTPHVWGNPDHKKILMRKFGTAVVDMETAALASVAESLSIPLRCLRVVSDEAEDSFLEPFSYDPSAGISKRAGQILKKGNPVKTLREWKCNTSVARVSLNRLLSEYL